MTSCARFAFCANDRETIEAAVQWIAGSHPDVVARFEGDSVRLASKRHAPARLDAILAAGIANERLMASGAAARLAARRMLAQ